MHINSEDFQSLSLSLLQMTDGYDRLMRHVTAFIITGHGPVVGTVPRQTSAVMATNHRCLWLWQTWV